MNAIETLKQERDGLEMKDAIVRYARTGWTSISEADVQRLKWHGLFLRKPTPGCFMLRVRIPGGRATSAQVRTLGEIAAEYGNGVLDLTTRQQVQVRQIAIERVPAIFTKMEEVGLTTLQTGMDTVRNVMTCPVAGLNPDELLDAAPAVLAITEEILDNREYSNLPRKFNVAVTGCRENCLQAETQDLAFVPARREIKGVSLAGFNVLAGGKLGSGGYRIATPLDIFVTPGEVLDVFRAVTLTYRDVGPRDSRTAARLAFLLDDWGEARFRAEVESRAGRPLARAGQDGRKPAAQDHVGIYRQTQPGFNYVGVKVPVGRVSAEDLLRVAALAEQYGTGEVRISPSQSLILPYVSDRQLGDLIEEPFVKRYGYNPSPIGQGLVSCVGSDYCNLAVIETKRRALETAKALEKQVGSRIKPITMHWSGCPAGCGNHQVADVGLLGKKIKAAGKVVDAVDVYVGGRSGPDPKLAVKLLEDVPCEKLVSVLEGIVPYHSREKMHRAQRGEVRRAAPPNGPVRLAGNPADRSVPLGRQG